MAAVIATVLSFTVSASEVSPDEAKAAVQAWLAKFGGMEGTRLGTLADKEPAAYTNAEGRTLFYVLDLAGGGYVVASANTKIAPVITFTDKGAFDPNPENPEYAMLTGDMADRLEAVDEYEAKKASSGKRLAAGASSQTEDEKEWAALVAGTPIDYDKQARAARRASKAGGRRLGAGDGESTLPFANEPDGMRAPQMVTTTWKQAGDYALGEPVENRYTPDYRACGCVATAYAQIGHFWRWPKKRIEPLLNDGTDPFSIVCMIDGVVTNLSLMGGVYDFSMMPSSYGQIKNVRQAEEIGRFVHDVAVACGERWHGGGAGSNTRSAKVPFINIFGYANGREGWSGNNTTPFVDGDKTYGMEDWELRIKRTLDVLLGGFDGGMPAVCSVPGHAILADGYQYVGGRLYVHFNFGWGGSSWYSFLNRDEYLRGYAQMRWVSQNIHPTIPGIVFSGRIYDEDGNAVEGAQVTLQGEFWDKGTNVVAQTNAVAMSNKYGIYHFRLQAVDAQGVTHHDGRFTVKANYAGLAESEAVTVERVKDWTSSSLAWKCDNLRGNDLTLTASTGRAVESVAIDGPSSATAGGKVQFMCKATLDDGTTRDVSPEWSIVLPDATGTTIDALTGEMSVGGVFDDKVTVRAVFTNLLQGAVLEAVKTVS
ncbi:MAG: C10 family peptidase, partial [Kiritimatiellae bacterium]|nr:C10 family peptidase [Kiritimatiellia bacterium]